MGGIFGPTPTPHKKLTLCGTGILPVLKNAEAKRPNPYSPQKTLCGTGILPVLKNAEAKRPNPYSPQKIDSLWNRHLACS
jgi:hypothetical protein